MTGYQKKDTAWPLQHNEQMNRDSAHNMQNAGKLAISTKQSTNNLAIECEKEENDLTNSKGRVTNVTPLILTPEEVAKRLSVSANTAIQVMLELPHINVSRDLYSGKKRIRITESTFDDFVSGRITRKRLRRGG